MSATLARELIETALRVLTRWTQGRRPTLEDAEALTLGALPEERSLDIDQLACRIVERELLGRDRGDAKEPDVTNVNRNREILSSKEANFTERAGSSRVGNAGGGTRRGSQAIMPARPV